MLGSLSQPFGHISFLARNRQTLALIHIFSVMDEYCAPYFGSDQRPIRRISNLPICCWANFESVWIGLVPYLLWRINSGPLCGSFSSLPLT